MRTVSAALALAALVWGCDAKATAESAAPNPAQSAEATWSARVKIDDV